MSLLNVNFCLKSLCSYAYKHEKIITIILIYIHVHITILLVFNPLCFSFQSTALRLITGFDSADVQPQFSSPRILQDAKQVRAGFTWFVMPASFSAALEKSVSKHI